jgi:hypothetical protein
MVLYTCQNCFKEFTKKCDFIYHTKKRKNPCNSIMNIINKNKLILTENNTNLQKLTEINNKTPKLTENINEHKCDKCNKSFVNIYSLKRHCDNYCKVKKANEKQIEKTKNNQVNIDELDIDDKTKLILNVLMNQNKKIIDEMKEEMNLIKEELNKEKQKNNKNITKNISNTSNTNNNTTNTNSNNTTTNTQNNNTINNTIILAHGKEDLSKIELEAIMGCMSTFKHREIIPNITKYVYLNDKKPENKNFCVVDTARNKCKYFDGKKWVIGKTNDKVTKIFDNIHNMLTDPFEKEHINKTIEFIKANPKKYNEKWIKVSNTYLKSLYDEEDKENMENKIKVLEELKLIFFNNKDEILKLN